MSEVSQIDLERLAREAADEVAGAESVLETQVELILDSNDEPAYRFVFAIDRAKMLRYEPGKMWVKLSQNIRDRLLAKGDETYPYVSIISPTEWQARLRA